MDRALSSDEKAHAVNNKRLSIAKYKLNLIKFRGNFILIIQLRVIITRNHGFVIEVLLLFYARNHQ